MPGYPQNAEKDCALLSYKLVDEIKLRTKIAAIGSSDLKDFFWLEQLCCLRAEAEVDTALISKHVLKRIYF